MHFPLLTAGAMVHGEYFTRRKVTQKTRVVCEILAQNVEILRQ
jgi:hypothetical protein